MVVDRQVKLEFVELTAYRLCAVMLAW